MKYSIFIFSLLILTFKVQSQSCIEDSLHTYEVRASDTDGNIAWELFKHFAWTNQTCAQKNKLLVYLPGTIDNPQNTTFFPSLAANNGFHVVNLKYPNSTSAQTYCNASTDLDCYENFRRETIEGIDFSTDVVVDATNCIENRLLKLLIYLDLNYPTEGWGAFYTGSSLNWNLFMVSGHSQGGGHAAIMAKHHVVDRVIMFASPNDFSSEFNAPAQWSTETHLTPDSLYYAFGNYDDDIVDFSKQHWTWSNMGLASFGDTVNAFNSVCPYGNSHQIYTTEQTAGLAGNHSNMVRDSMLTLDQWGIPIYQEAWKYLLGLPCDMNSNPELISNDNFKIYPVPLFGKTRVHFGHPTPNLKVESVQLFDAMGREIKIELIDDSIDLSHIESGVYRLLITNNGGFSFSRTIVKD